MGILIGNRTHGVTVRVNDPSRDSPALFKFLCKIPQETGHFSTAITSLERIIACVDFDRNHCDLLIPVTIFLPSQKAKLPLIVASGKCTMLQAGHIV
jgi:hypothetical protein